jgi:hypothetical protein
MKKWAPFIALIVVFLTIGLACSMPLTPVVKATPTDTPESITDTPTATAASETILSPLVTVTSRPFNTITPLPTSTNTTIPPTAIPVVNTPAGTCNLAYFEADINYIDDTVVPAGNNFDKKWRLRNNGTCTWTSGYKVIFVSGDAMGGAGAVQLTNGTVPPGSSVEVSVNLTAPAAPGTYRGNYKLQSSDGVAFGIDPAGSVFYVRIAVENANGDVPASDDESNNNGGNDNPSSNIPALSRNMKLANPYMRGNDVLSLQKKLIARGYNIVGSADGVFGKKTDAGVRQFQADQGLVVDGVVGPKTWAALWN